MRCPFPMKYLFSTCRLTLIPGGWSATWKLSRNRVRGSNRSKPARHLMKRRYRRSRFWRGELFLLRNDQRHQRFRIKFLELRKCCALGHPQQRISEPPQTDENLADAFIS